jgi:hypothetical protein
MNRTELIEKIIRRLSYDSVTPHDTVRIKQILEEELPDYQRIDEERMTNLWERKFNKMYLSSVQKLIQEYNSTLPSPLVPLPKEMPKEFYDVAKMHSSHGTWQWLLEHYGTPSKEPLPSVEELEKELSKLWGKDIEMIQKGVAKYLHSKYSLPPKQEDVDKLKEELEDERIRHAACGTAALGYFTGCHEKYLSASLQDVINLRLKYEGLLNKQKEEKVFPFNLKEGDKFKWEKEVQKFKKFRTYLVDEDGITYLATTCTPYTTPSAQDIISKHNLTDEEVRVIREGNV